LETVAEQNVYFRLSRYQAAIHRLISDGRLHVVPEARRNEVLSFVERGLSDISISRDAARSGGWGIPYPGDASQVVYVWIDALVNYLTGLGFPDGDLWRRTWRPGTRRVHVIGKNVWKFHAVYWPALLLAAGFDPPGQIVVHGFLTQDGRKISKSRGDAADPFGCIERFGADALRYFLLRHVRPFQDSDFSEARLEEAYQADLANGLGNLSSRLTALCARFGVEAERGARAGRIDPYSADLARDVGRQIEAFRFDRALDRIWREVDRLNREIATGRPWDSDPGAESRETRARLGRWAGELLALARALRPFLPTAAARIERHLATSTIRPSAPLFPRLDASGSR
jgi:methionyl-tRNA synthetase